MKIAIITDAIIRKLDILSIQLMNGTILDFQIQNLFSNIAYLNGKKYSCTVISNNFINININEIIRITCNFPYASILLEQNGNFKRL